MDREKFIRFLDLCRDDLLRETKIDSGNMMDCRNFILGVEKAFEKIKVLLFQEENDAGEDKGSGNGQGFSRIVEQLRPGRSTAWGGSNPNKHN